MENLALKLARSKIVDSPITRYTVTLNTTERCVTKISDDAFTLANEKESIPAENSPAVPLEKTMRLQLVVNNPRASGLVR